VKKKGFKFDCKKCSKKKDKMKKCVNKKERKCSKAMSFPINDCYEYSLGIENK